MSYKLLMEVRMANKIIEKIKTDLNQAILKKNDPEKGTLRMLLSEIHNAEIAKKGELLESELQKVVSSQVKKRKEAILEYQKAGRKDLALKEQKELEILQNYLPKMVTPAEIEKRAKEVISETSAKTMADFGKVMGLLMKEFSGKADGAQVSAIVKRMLGGSS